MKQFDLETDIMNCWQVCEDLNVFSEAVMEKNLTTDQMVNVLVGMRELYNIKFDKLFNTFEEYLKERKQERDRLKKEPVVL